MKNLLSFIFLAINFLQIHSFNDLRIIQAFLEEKSLKLVTIFGCFYKNDKINFSRLLMANTQQISFFNIKEHNLKKILEIRHNHLGIVLNGECPNIQRFLIMCGNLNFFHIRHHWLILTSSDDFLKNFENVTFNINADIHVAVSNLETATWSIFDVYNPASNHGGVLNYSQIGFFNQKFGYQFQKNENKYWTRRNLTGVTFNSMIVLPVAFEGTLQNYLNSDENRDINTFNRMHNRLLSFCRDYYNYSVKIEKVESWGYTNPDGTFDGMVGALDQKTIDFGSSPLFLREDRARVIDYGRNTWILRAAFLFRNPKDRTSIEIFLHPLPTSVWLITGLFAIISIVILKIVTTFERKKYHFQTETSWGVSVILTLGAFCQQGSPSTPKMVCGRITTISIFLLSVLIYQFYSASLVSHLLMKPDTKIQNIEDILESSLRAGCEDILYDRDYFKHTTDEVAIELFNKKILGKRNSSNFFTPEEGLKLVEQGGFAFHVETATAYPLIESTFAAKSICELREVQMFRTQPMHANYQKNSPFRDMFDTCFQRISEYGLLNRERKHWHPRKPECIQSSKSISFNVGIDEFYPALVILFIGIVSSLTILVCEKQYKMIKEKPVGYSKVVLKKKQVFPFVK